MSETRARTLTPSLAAIIFFLLGQGQMAMSAEETLNQKADSSIRKMREGTKQMPNGSLSSQRMNSTIDTPSSDRSSLSEETPPDPGQEGEGASPLFAPKRKGEGQEGRQTPTTSSILDDKSEKASMELDAFSFSKDFPECEKNCKEKMTQSKNISQIGREAEETGGTCGVGASAGFPLSMEIAKMVKIKDCKAFCKELDQAIRKTFDPLAKPSSSVLPP